MKILESITPDTQCPSKCCCRTTAAIEPRVGRFGSICGRVLRWVLPSVALALVPKCPACFAMYFALATGIGLSISTASYLRIIVIFGCVLLLVSAAAGPVRSLLRRAWSKSELVAR